MGSPNTQPFEIIGAPFSLYKAAVSTAAPAIDAAPGVGWTLIGTNGALNYGDEGVTITPSQNFNFFRALGDSGSRKAFRTEEDLEIALTLYDMTIEQVARALNENAITTTAAGVGVAGSKKIGLSRGLGIATMALLVRGPSPYGDNMNMQFWVPMAVQVGSPEMAFRRDQPVGVKLSWKALVDPSQSADQYFGFLEAETAPAS